MKKTKSAVKYGMETLRLSPDELFKLIESSRGYSGEDYSRWLAGKIIEVAEGDGVQFSQLLVKKFNIINSILEETSNSSVMKEEFLDLLKTCLRGTIYSIGFEGLGETLNVDWYSGVDLDKENSFFVIEKLPNNLKRSILEDEKISFLSRLSLDSPNKKSDLYWDAKNAGIPISCMGALMIYRFCSMVLAFELTNALFGLLVPVNFLYSQENEEIIRYMLDIFRIYAGFSIKSIEASDNSLNSGNLAYIVLKPRLFGEESQDGVVLPEITMNAESNMGYDVLSHKRYSRSEGFMLNKIASKSVALTDSVPEICEDNNLRMGEGYKKALGYLNVNGSISITTLPESGRQSIAITGDNIKDVIAYFGVRVSGGLGDTEDIPEFLDGKEGYGELLYNCLPLFLFDYRVHLKNIEYEGVMYKNKLDILDSEVLSDLLDVGLPYFSFEAKELYNLCKDYILFTKDNIGVTGKSFTELRELSNSSDFNSLYESKLYALMEFVNKLSKEYM